MTDGGKATEPRNGQKDDPGAGIPPGSEGERVSGLQILFYRDIIPRVSNGTDEGKHIPQHTDNLFFAAKRIKGIGGRVLEMSCAKEKSSQRWHTDNEMEQDKDHGLVQKVDEK
jgi:hypothetical protein